MNRDWRSKFITFYDESTKKVASVSERQNDTTNDVPVKGSMWSCKFDIECPPEDDARQLLFKAINHHDEGNGPYPKASTGRIEGHWTGFRPGVEDKAPAPQISDVQTYACMSKDTKNDLVIFYIYGGAFYMNGPTQYRRVYARLARETGGRVFVVRQRLCPQNPFPATLLDVLHGYLALIAPPPGSLHEPVPPSKIIIAGESSGGCLVLGLLQVLLTIKREAWAKTLRFYGRSIMVNDWLPAGIAPTSPIADLTHGLPSHQRNIDDVMPRGMPHLDPDFWPSCELWPTDPPRGCMYCDVPNMLHPINSPCLVRDWTGSPPMWIGMGQESGEDSVKLLVQTAVAQGVKVVFSEYELMPHFFAVVYAPSPQSQKLWRDWTAAMQDMAAGRLLTSRAVFVQIKDLRERELQFDQLVPLTRQQARQYMTEATMGQHPFRGQQRPSGPKM